MKEIATVVIPAAGLGTRMLPATKSIPKELLPVYDRPLIQFAIDEAIYAGAKRIVVVVSPGKGALLDYLRKDELLARQLMRKGKSDLCAALDRTGIPDGVELCIAEQTQPLGLGHAVLMSASHLLPGPFGVILPDDLILGTSCLAEMGRAYSRGHMIAAAVVAESDVSSYGIFVPAGPAGLPPAPAPVPVRGMVEKPSSETAPSRLAAVGRYILNPDIIHTLSRLGPGAGGEVQLTDAITLDAPRQPLAAFRFSGKRFDCGSHDGLLAAAVTYHLSLRTQDQSTSASVVL
jgi:UTP--glucose-1-phosphate uridylyltransferase